MRGVLHGSLNHVADPRYASGETGRGCMRSTYARSALCDFWPAGASGVLCRAAADGGDVRGFTGGGAGVFTAAGSGDDASAASERVTDGSGDALVLLLRGVGHGIVELVFVAEIQRDTF